MIVVGVVPAFVEKGEERLSHLGHCGGVFGREFATRLDILGQFDGVAHTDESMPFGSRNSEHRLQKHARHDLFGKGDHEIEFGSTLSQDGIDQVVNMVLYRSVQGLNRPRTERSEEHTSELQSIMRISYAVFFLKKKKQTK